MPNPYEAPRSEVLADEPNYRRRGIVGGCGCAFMVAVIVLTVLVIMSRMMFGPFWGSPGGD